jgi:hypothetical protein
MRYKRIPDNDSLFRSCIYPIQFKNSGRSFAPEKALQLKHIQENDSLIGSLAWERYVPTTKYVHAYGCRIAFYMNKNFLANGGNVKKQRIYCGSYQLKVYAIRDLANVDELHEISSADAVHFIENREIAHTEMRIFLKSGDVDVEGTKTAIIDRLWNACSGPLKHISACDQDIKPHPSSVLKTSPSGPYNDTRTYIYRLWSIIRFRVYYWVWYSLCKKIHKKIL